MAPNAGPVVAKPTEISGQQRVVLDRLEDAVEIVGDGGEETRRELRPKRAGIVRRRRGHHEIERRQQTIELDRASHDRSRGAPAPWRRA